MKIADGVAMFGEWFADLPELDNPGLTEANNAIWTEGGYEPFHPLKSVANGTLASYPLAVMAPYAPVATEMHYAYAYANNLIHRLNVNGSGTWTVMSATLVAIHAQFAQFDDLVILAYGAPGAPPPVASTVGSSTAFTVLSTTGTAPGATVIGVINRFVVLGNGGTSSNGSWLRWSAINQPRDWPTPNTATAVAAQAGEQYLQAQYGDIRQIIGLGNQFGIVLQESAVTRMTYVGGNVVFQFDLVDSTAGSFFPHGAVLVGDTAYFASRSGFYATDGVQVVPIGRGKVDEYFAESIYSSIYGQNYLVSCGYDSKRDLIYWSFPNNSATAFSGSLRRPNKLLIYHRGSGRWTSADQEMFGLVAPAGGYISPAGSTQDLYGFSSAFVYSRFDGTAGSATFTTAEMEHNRGGYSLAQGVKPLIQGKSGSTAPAVTVAIGTRNDQNPSSLTYTSATTATASTGFCDFRSSARYHRAKVTVTGEFESAKGLEWQITPQGVR